jgi:flagellar protein FlbD
MIKLTKAGGEDIIVNAEEIESVEGRPDSIITLRSGRKLRVNENNDKITEKVIRYKRLCYRGLLDLTNEK